METRLSKSTYFSVESEKIKNENRPFNEHRPRKIVIFQEGITQPVPGTKIHKNIQVYQVYSVPGTRYISCWCDIQVQKGGNQVRDSGSFKIISTKRASCAAAPGERNMGRERKKGRVFRAGVLVYEYSGTSILSHWIWYCSCSLLLLAYRTFHMRGRIICIILYEASSRRRFVFGIDLLYCSTIP